MLTRLKVTNFLLIHELELEFLNNVTVVTGETGSGKSIIIDALMLVFGARSSTDIIRLNQTQATFEAEFTLSNIDACNYLRENDLVNLDTPQSLICRRIIDRNGKNKIYLNGHMATVSQVKLLGDLILDIHTQHSSITLLKPEMQRNLLDEYIGITHEVEDLAKFNRKINQVSEYLQKASLNQEELLRKRGSLQDEIAEISNLNIESNEWETLEKRHKELTNVDTILNELNFTETILVNEDESILTRLNQVKARISKLVEYRIDLTQVLDLLESISIELREITYVINAIVKNIDQDSNSLENIEARMDQIFTLSRKYRVNPNELTSYLVKIQGELDAITHETNVIELQKELQELQNNYNILAKVISDKRSNAATILSDKVTKLLSKLAINGQFSIMLHPLKGQTNYGLENIDYQVCFNKGMQLQSLNKVASGGELSRTALAIYLLLSIHNPPEVIIFDEIDVGIGGKVAAIVGQMLRELGKDKQVICITHQPQTASFANHHLVVNKAEMHDNVQTEVKYIKEEERIKEIARMLGGIKITQATLEHAKEMLSHSNSYPLR